MTLFSGKTILALAGIALFMAISMAHAEPSYVIVDTGQNQCFNDTKQVDCPTQGQAYFGQDGQYQGNQPAYRDNGDGTTTDLNTGLIWQKKPDFKAYGFQDAKGYAEDLNLGGHDDWRLPTIKELFSIADFNGNQHTETPYIDTRYFDYVKPLDSGDPNIHRSMDGQYWSSNKYVGTTMGRDESAFGFNFADGRIKSYPIHKKKSFVRCVRGKPYGINDFKDNGDGTITDRATALIWQKGDSGKTMIWKEALSYAQNSKLAGHDDWRLPNVKELQSLVDYNRAPDARKSSMRSTAIDPIFQVTDAEAWYWASTTFLENVASAYYVAFGQAFAATKYQGKQINAHGAGAVRSDPKSGDPGRWAGGHGPQSDEIRINNYARLVRGGTATSVPGSNKRIDLGTRPGKAAMGMNQQGGQRGNMGMGGPPQGMSQSQGQGMGQGQGPGPDMFFQRFDQNGDGVVSQDEFRGPPQHFKQFDKNNDGVIERDEAPTGPPPGRQQ